jgi:hypothetical protein
MKNVFDQPNFTYSYADLTNAYSNPSDPALIAATKSQKMALDTREMMYLKSESSGGDDFVVVFDRVNSTNAAFQKFWLLHTMQQPVINGTISQTITLAPTDPSCTPGNPTNNVQYNYTGGDGTAYAISPVLSISQDESYFVPTGVTEKLFMKMLLPTDGLLRDVEGYNYNSELGGAEYCQEEGDEGEVPDYGSHRIEETPGHARTNDFFLNVLFPTGSSTQQMVPTTLVTSDDLTSMYGAHIADINAPGDRVVLFSQSTTTVTNSFSYTLTNSNPLTTSDQIIVDIAPSFIYNVTNTDLTTNQVAQTLSLNSTSNGTLEFSVTLGSKSRIAVIPNGALPPPPPALAPPGIPTFTNLSPQMPLSATLQADDQSGGPVYTWNWVINGLSGTGSGNSNSSAPSVSYSQQTTSGALAFNSIRNLSPGTYTIQVTASNSAGTSYPAVAQVTIVSGNLSSVSVYPDPWVSRNNGSIPITFVGLTDPATIKLFTVSGHWIKTIDSTGGKATWDLTNDSGEKVASGIYLYLITDNQGQKTKGKLAIVR